MALEDSLLESDDGKSTLGLNEFDTTDALRLDIINRQNTVWLGDNVSSIGIYIIRTMIIIYLMISIAVCIVLCVQLEEIVSQISLGIIICGIRSRLTTVTIADDIGLAEIVTVDAYGWIIIMQFKWIAFVIILLWLFEAAIQDDWILDTRFKWIVIVAGILLAFYGLFKDTIEYYWQFDDIIIYIEDIILFILLYAIHVLKFINNGFVIYIFDVGWIRISKDAFVIMIQTHVSQPNQQVMQQYNYIGITFYCKRYLLIKIEDEQFVQGLYITFLQCDETFMLITLNSNDMNHSARLTLRKNNTHILNQFANMVQGLDFVVRSDSANDIPLRKQQMAKQQQQSVPQYFQQEKKMRKFAS